MAKTGSRAVPLKTTGHEKDHFTVVLTVCADGKMKAYVVFKGKGTRLIKQLKSIPDIVVTFSSNAWMNDLGRLLVCYHSANVYSFGTLTSATQVRLPRQNFVGSMLIWHLCPEAVLNACFKARHYDLWFFEPSVHEYTRGGNLKDPNHSLLFQWVSWPGMLFQFYL